MLEPSRLCESVVGVAWSVLDGRMNSSSGDEEGVELKKRFARQYQIANYFVNQVSRC